MTTEDRAKLAAEAFAEFQAGSLTREQLVEQLVLRGAVTALQGADFGRLIGGVTYAAAKMSTETNPQPRLFRTDPQNIWTRVNKVIMLIATGSGMEPNDVRRALGMRVGHPNLASTVNMEAAAEANPDSLLNVMRREAAERETAVSQKEAD
jgi:hypothetical protein